MIDLIFKTLLRVLLIFVPFAVLSLHKSISSEQSTGFILIAVAVIISLIAGLMLSLAWWREKKRVVKRSLTGKNPKIIPVGEQNR